MTDALIIVAGLVGVIALLMMCIIALEHDLAQQWRDRRGV